MSESNIAIEALLSTLEQISGAFRAFSGEILPREGFDKHEWLSDVQKFKTDCDELFEKHLQEDNAFADFCYEEADRDLNLYCLRRIDENVGEGFYEINENIAPFPEYNDAMSELYSYCRRLEWLSKKYGPGDPREISDLGKYRKYGDFTFMINPKGEPLKVSFKGKEMPISQARLKYFYVVAAICRHLGGEASVKDIEEALGETDYHALDKLQYDTNNDIRKATGIKHIIKAPRRGYRTLSI